VNLFTENERWRAYWRHVTDLADVRRQLVRLRWLEEFIFHCGPEITPQDFQAVQEQIARGERRLAELEGDFVAPSAACPETPSPARSEVVHSTPAPKRVSGLPESSVSGASA
jgi:hypothetical protein